MHIKDNNSREWYSKLVWKSDLLQFKLKKWLEYLKIWDTSLVLCHRDLFSWLTGCGVNLQSTLCVNCEQAYTCTSYDKGWILSAWPVWPVTCTGRVAKRLSFTKCWSNTPCKYSCLIYTICFPSSNRALQLARLSLEQFSLRLWM